MISASGSGKGTCLRCLNLPEQPHGGRVEIGGEALRLRPARDRSLKAHDPLQPQGLRSQVARMFQHVNHWAYMTAL